MNLAEAIDWVEQAVEPLQVGTQEIVRLLALENDRLSRELRVPLTRVAGQATNAPFLSAATHRPERLVQIWDGVGVRVPVWSIEEAYRRYPNWPGSTSGPKFVVYDPTAPAAVLIPKHFLSVAITGATGASPVVITATSHPFASGNQVFISGVGGMTEINNRTFTVNVLTANTFQLVGENGTGHTAYTSGGIAGETLTYLVASRPTPLVSDADQIWTATGGSGGQLPEYHELVPKKVSSDILLGYNNKIQDEATLSSLIRRGELYREEVSQGIESVSALRSFTPVTVAR